MNGLSITFCAPFFRAEYRPTTVCVPTTAWRDSPLQAELLMYRIRYSTQSNFLMVVPQANHPLLRQPRRNSLYFEFLLRAAAGCSDEGETRYSQLSPAVGSSSSSPPPPSSAPPPIVVDHCIFNRYHFAFPFLRVLPQRDVTLSCDEPMYLSNVRTRKQGRERFLRSSRIRRGV